MAHGEALDDITDHIDINIPTATHHQSQQQPNASGQGHQAAPSTESAEMDDLLLVDPVHPFLQNECASLTRDNIAAITEHVTWLGDQQYYML